MKHSFHSIVKLALGVSFALRHFSLPFMASMVKLAVTMVKVWFTPKATTKELHYTQVSELESGAIYAQVVSVASRVSISHLCPYQSGSCLIENYTTKPSSPCGLGGFLIGATGIY